MTYFQTLRAINVSDLVSGERKTVKEPQTLAPSCPHGPAKISVVRKDGVNKAWH